MLHLITELVKTSVDTQVDLNMVLRPQWFSGITAFCSLSCPMFFFNLISSFIRAFFRRSLSYFFFNLPAERALFVVLDDNAEDSDDTLDDDADDDDDDKDDEEEDEGDNHNQSFNYSSYMETSMTIVIMLALLTMASYPLFPHH